ncbi:MAG: BREX system ATP-binding domain-containing protein, partial [Sciscionella sp.]
APGILGGGSMSATAYAEFLGAEYLSSYLPAGGGSVKVAVAGDADVAARFERGLQGAAELHNCLMVSLTAEATRVHMVDQVFFTVARQLDWDLIAAAIVRGAYNEIAIPPGADSLRVSDVAAAHGLDPRELYRSVRRRLEQTLLLDTRLPRMLRRALLRLAQWQLGAGDVDATEARVVRGWLIGEKVPLRELREQRIYARVGRHNARGLLAAVGECVQRADRGGVVIYFDLSRLAVVHRPPREERTGVYYTKASTLDAYELVRQLIDAIDELAGMLVVAVIPPELVSDERRGLPAYAALQLRVADEVRDRRRPNPFAALVRLDVRLEAVR